jgi:flagellar biosynthesis/type III secretory pathway protein FliH
MAAAISIPVGKMICAIQTLSGADSAATVNSAAANKELAAMKNKFQSACQALNAAAQQTEQYGQRLFAVHREQIIHLAVQIASRILATQIERNDYQIQNILTEALSATPGGSILEIRINPDDLKTYEQAVQGGQPGIHENITLTADWSVGKAECIVITNEGLVEFTMVEHLRQIEAAMQATPA